MGVAIVDLINLLLGAIVWLVIINAVVSWLVAFDVINPRNQLVYSILRFLDAVTGPILSPLRRVIPAIGGVDISPIVVILAIRFIIQPAFNSYLAPYIIAAL